MGALHPDGQEVVCGPSKTATMCASVSRGNSVNFAFLSLDPTDYLYTPLFDIMLPPSPFHYIRVNGTLYFLAASETDSSVFLGGVVPSLDGTALYQHFITELRSQSESLSDVSIGPVVTIGNGVLLILSLDTGLHLIPLSNDFHATKEALTIGGGLQSLDWISQNAGGNAALGRACPSAWRLMPDESSNTILVVCKNRLQQLKLTCSGPHFSQCSFQDASQNATSKFTNSPADILHETNNAAVCYIMMDQTGLLSYTSSAFPSPLERLTSAPLVDEDTKKTLRVSGGLCSPPDGQGSMTYFVNEDGELYKLALVGGAPKCEKLGYKCASCSISACRRDPETLALNDTGLIKIIDLAAKQVHPTSLPAASNLSLFGWRTEHSVPPSTTTPGAKDLKVEPDSLRLIVALPIVIVVATPFVIALVVGLVVISLTKRRARRKSERIPIPCTNGESTSTDDGGSTATEDSQIPIPCTNADISLGPIIIATNPQ